MARSFCPLAEQVLAEEVSASSDGCKHYIAALPGGALLEELVAGVDARCWVNKPIANEGGTWAFTSSRDFPFKFSGL
jgi:hypothetical protein